MANKRRIPTCDTEAKKHHTKRLNAVVPTPPTDQSQSLFCQLQVLRNQKEPPSRKQFFTQKNVLLVPYLHTLRRPIKCRFVALICVHELLFISANACPSTTAYALFHTHGNLLGVAFKSALSPKDIQSKRPNASLFPARAYEKKRSIHQWIKSKFSPPQTLVQAVIPQY